MNAFAILTASHQKRAMTITAYSTRLTLYKPSRSRRHEDHIAGLHPADLGHRLDRRVRQNVHIGDFPAQLRRTSTTLPACW